MKFDVFGSCITRDPFEFSSSNHTVGKYIARSSLVSAADDKPLSMPIEFDLGNNFRNRCLNDDLQKDFRNYVHNSESEVLVIDLIQERYGLNRLNDGLFTYSQDFRKAKLPIGKIIRYDNHFELFKKYIYKISDMLSGYKTIIIHEANLCPIYYKNNGEIGSLPINETDEYFLEHGSKYYNLIKEIVPNTFSLKITGYIGSETHKWGPGKAHYEDEYHQRFNEGLDFILKENDNFYYIKDYGILKNHVVR